MSFDTDAKTWDADPKKVERAEVLAKIISDFNKGKGLGAAMEFGCGTGLLSFFLKNEFSNIILADTSPGMIEVLKDKISNAGVSNFTPVLLGPDSSLQSGSFDIIYSLMTMHHVSDLDAAFSEFDRLLNPQGYLCIADLLEEEGDFHSEEVSKDLHHGFNKEKLLLQLKTKGFDFVAYQIFYTIEKTTDKGLKKSFPLFVLMVQKRA